MEIRYRPRFVREYRKLPREVKRAAERKEKWFRDDPFDSRLKTHKLHGMLLGFYSFSIHFRYRIIFAFAKDKVVEFYSVGDHSIYE